MDCINFLFIYLRIISVFSRYEKTLIRCRQLMRREKFLKSGRLRFFIRMEKSHDMNITVCFHAVFMIYISNEETLLRDCLVILKHFLSNYCSVLIVSYLSSSGYAYVIRPQHVYKSLFSFNYLLLMSVFLQCEKTLSRGK